ncbi:ketopantoate reductase family protein [Brachybacterium alimentarium]|uniref:ketopantoate reductase family protein n=1 Tax=Brachybacterium alimentarium TaxID=47845 RepID=UPI000BB7E980|nr:2-dehydropantoate 2-reductase [Brachybacterium alimentarium]PCC31706.1 2-dehydropantoate 2-reductase [Brachybacterium alimentarium]
MTRTLIVGAGATGGALGARLIAAEQDVTFLVRERRAAQLAADGLRFRAPDVDGVHMARAVTALERADPFDLVIVAVKALVLEAIVSTVAPAIGPETRIVPLLNGMAHIDLLERAFPGQVLGGIVKIIAALDEDATVVQMTPLCNVTVGGLLGEAVPVDIRRTLDVDGIALEVVDDIASRLWEKWAFIAAAGVITCLFRGTIGDILAAGGEAQILQAIAECEQIAEAAGHPVSAAGHAQSLGLLTESGSAFTSSLYRDLQHGDPVEAEHIIGDLAARAAALETPAPLLDAALLQLPTHHQAAPRQQRRG